jgi:hypothetical protein
MTGKVSRAVYYNFFGDCSKFRSVFAIMEFISLEYLLSDEIFPKAVAYSALGALLPSPSLSCFRSAVDERPLRRGLCFLVGGMAFASICAGSYWSLDQIKVSYEKRDGREHAVLVCCSE